MHPTTPAIYKNTFSETNGQLEEQKVTVEQLQEQKTPGKSSNARNIKRRN